MIRKIVFSIKNAVRMTFKNTRVTEELPSVFNNVAEELPTIVRLNNVQSAKCTENIDQLVSYFQHVNAYINYSSQ